MTVPGRCLTMGFQIGPSVQLSIVSAGNWAIALPLESIKTS